MERYSHLLANASKRITASDFNLACVGTLVSDDGGTIIVQEQFFAAEARKQYEWKFRIRTSFA